MKLTFKRFVNDDSGATVIEYGLIASFDRRCDHRATALGTSLNSTFNAISTKITGPSA
jgi:pilus assembly protein Flp/PilA